MTELAMGVPIPWAQAGPADFTPLISVLGAVLILRFVVGARLTVMTTMLAIFVGALWAYGIERWGMTLPSVVTLLLIARLRTTIGRARAT